MSGPTKVNNNGMMSVKDILAQLNSVQDNETITDIGKLGGKNVVQIKTDRQESANIRNQLLDALKNESGSQNDRITELRQQLLGKDFAEHTDKPLTARQIKQVISYAHTSSANVDKILAKVLTVGDMPKDVKDLLKDTLKNNVNNSAVRNFLNISDDTSASEKLKLLRQVSRLAVDANVENDDNKLARAFLDGFAGEGEEVKSGYDQEKDRTNVEEMVRVPVFENKSKGVTVDENGEKKQLTEFVDINSLHFSLDSNEQIGKHEIKSSPNSSKAGQSPNVPKQNQSLLNQPIEESKGKDVKLQQDMGKEQTVEERKQAGEGLRETQQQINLRETAIKIPQNSPEVGQGPNVSEQNQFAPEQDPSVPNQPIKSNKVQPQPQDMNKGLTVEECRRKGAALLEQMLAQAKKDDHLQSGAKKSSLAHDFEVIGNSADVGCEPDAKSLGDRKIIETERKPSLKEFKASMKTELDNLAKEIKSLGERGKNLIDFVGLAKKAQTEDEVCEFLVAGEEAVKTARAAMEAEALEKAKAQKGIEMELPDINTSMNEVEAGDDLTDWTFLDLDDEEEDIDDRNLDNSMANLENEVRNEQEDVDVSLIENGTENDLDRKMQKMEQEVQQEQNEGLGYPTNPVIENAKKNIDAVNAVFDKCVKKNQVEDQVVEQELAKLEAESSVKVVNPQQKAELEQKQKIKKLTTATELFYKEKKKLIEKNLANFIIGTVGGINVPKQNQLSIRKRAKNLIEKTLSPDCGGILKKIIEGVVVKLDDPAIKGQDGLVSQLSMNVARICKKSIANFLEKKKLDPEGQFKRCIEEGTAGQRVHPQAKNNIASKTQSNQQVQPKQSLQTNTPAGITSNHIGQNRADKISENAHREAIRIMEEWKNSIKMKSDIEQMLLDINEDLVLRANEYFSAFEILFADDWQNNYDLMHPHEWQCHRRYDKVPQEQTDKGVLGELQTNVLQMLKEIVEAQRTLNGAVDGVHSIGNTQPAPAEYCENDTAHPHLPKGAQDVSGLQQGHIFAQSGYNTCPILSTINAMSMAGGDPLAKLKEAMLQHSNTTHAPDEYYYQFTDSEGKQFKVYPSELSQSSGASEFERAAHYALKKCKLIDENLGEVFEVQNVTRIFGLPAMKNVGANVSTGKLTKDAFLKMAAAAVEALQAHKPCVLGIPGHYMAVKSVTMVDGQPVFTVVDSFGGPKEEEYTKEALDRIAASSSNAADPRIAIFSPQE